jgi:hypothetical protein
LSNTLNRRIQGLYVMDRRSHSGGNMEDRMTDTILDLSAEVLEALKDEVIQDSVLRELPIFGWFIKSVPIAGDVRDTIFRNKIAKFLSVKTAVSEKEREDFQNRINSDPEHRKKVGSVTPRLTWRAISCYNRARHV